MNDVVRLDYVTPFNHVIMTLCKSSDGATYFLHCCDVTLASQRSGHNILHRTFLVRMVFAERFAILYLSRAGHMLS